MFNNVFLDVLRTYILKRLKEDLHNLDSKILVVDDSASLISDDSRLKFEVRIISCLPVDDSISRTLSQEILEEFSLPGFRVDLLMSSPVSPI